MSAIFCRCPSMVATMTATKTPIPCARSRLILGPERGRTLLGRESTTGGWGDGPSGAPLHDYKTHRFGADPPATRRNPYAN